MRSKDGATTVHKCSRQQALRGSRWVGCVGHVSGPFYAACSQRCVLQLDEAGKRVQELRIQGNAARPGEFRIVS